MYVEIVLAVMIIVFLLHLLFRNVYLINVKLPVALMVILYLMEYALAVLVRFVELKHAMEYPTVLLLVKTKFAHQLAILVIL